MENFTKPYQKEHETIEHILPQTPNEDRKRILNNTDGVKGKQESKRF